MSSLVERNTSANTVTISRGAVVKQRSRIMPKHQINADVSIRFKRMFTNLRVAFPLFQPKLRVQTDIGGERGWVAKGNHTPSR